jgi:hypothetical protein
MAKLQRRIWHWLHRVLITRFEHGGFHHAGRIDW